MRDISILGFACLAALTFAHEPTATISDGVINGRTIVLPTAAASVHQFLGVPFAASPVRFSPPQAPTPWSTPLEAKSFKPACIQQFKYPLERQQRFKSVLNRGDPEESEDCLYLNIYAPSSPAPEDGRAVLFWLFGGSLEYGTGSLEIYNATAFAAYEDVLVVTSNYRTNVFGFPNSAELDVADNNLGFLDQRMALDWVQHNIHAFGGDPDKVTIFGQSAGAWSVDALLTSYDKDSKPPFRGAILQSGQRSHENNQWMPNTESFRNLSTALGCEGSALSCVRNASATDVKEIIETLSLKFDPAVDNKTVVPNMKERRISGNVAPVPVMIGTTGQEGSLYYPYITNITEVYEELFGQLPQIWPVLDEAYSNGSVYERATEILTEAQALCPVSLWANNSAEAGVPTWRYIYNGSFPNDEFLPNTTLRAYHTSDIWQVFTSYEAGTETAQQAALSNYMRGAWARFAKNPVGGPGWNPVGAASAFVDSAKDLDVAIFGSGSSGKVELAGSSDIDKRCEVWQSLMETTQS